MSNGTGEELWKFLETVYKSPVPIPGSSISIPVPNSKVVNNLIDLFFCICYIYFMLLYHYIFFIFII